MFVIILKYVKPISEIDKCLADHVEFLKQHFASGNFIFAGAQIPREGGIILCNASSRSEVHTIMEQDPFHINAVSENTIIEFNPSMFAKGFDQFIQ